VYLEEFHTVGDNPVGIMVDPQTGKVASRLLLFRSFSGRN
jgi:hypothetical protein